MVAASHGGDGALLSRQVSTAAASCIYKISGLYIGVSALLAAEVRAVHVEILEGAPLIARPAYSSHLSASRTELGWSPDPRPPLAKRVFAAV